MPVSIQFQITPCVSKIIGVQPKSVLDVGCGFGKWGYLCREYLDAFHGRFRPEDWTTRIDGVEFFEPYILDHQRALYSNIMIGDIRDLIDGLDDYDLIIAGDVIEHLHKDEAEVIVEKLYNKARKMLIVNIPLGTGWDHPEQYGNTAELHRSEWYQEDFAPYSDEFAHFELPTGIKYGAFFCEKPRSVEDRAAGLATAGNFYLGRREIEVAERYARRAIALAPNRPEGTLVLANLQIEQGNIQEALRSLEAGVESNPADCMLRLYLAQLHHSLGNKMGAMDLVTAVLATPGLHEEQRRDAEALLGKWG